jgi:hypothetical protein
MCNELKSFNIKQFNIFKFDEVVIYTNPKMWYPQKIHIVLSSEGWPSIGIKGHCKYIFYQNREPYVVYHRI